MCPVPSILMQSQRKLNNTYISIESSDHSDWLPHGVDCNTNAQERRKFVDITSLSSKGSTGSAHKKAANIIRPALRSTRYYHWEEGTGA